MTTATHILDPEFGKIRLRRIRRSRAVRLRLDANGDISISLPMRTPLYIAKQLINDSRHRLRNSLQHINERHQTFRNGDRIGKSHQLIFIESEENAYGHYIEGNKLLVTLPSNPDLQKQKETIHEAVIHALRIQAKAYLPRQLAYLAVRFGFDYEKVRLGSPGTRWGSCSSKGTISLNIWLMSLPFELIDYVIIHELCHTKQLNHSPRFWQLVELHCPEFKIHRRTLKSYTPYI